MEPCNTISNEKLDHYFDLSTKALKKAKIADKKELDSQKVAELFYDMAERYIGDAAYFRQNGMIIEAFAALNYAHAWLDAGALIGIFNVGGDNTLFTVDEET